MYKNIRFELANTMIPNQVYLTITKFLSQRFTDRRKLLSTSSSSSPLLTYTHTRRVVILCVHAVHGIICIINKYEYLNTDLWVGTFVRPTGAGLWRGLYESSRQQNLYGYYYTAQWDDVLRPRELCLCEDLGLG